MYNTEEYTCETGAKMDIKARAKKLKSDIPAVFIALRKKETPLSAKIIAAVTVLYALSPIDIIPDFIPIIGMLDDIILLPALISLTIKLIPEDIFIECRKEAEDLWLNGKPKKWYYALPIVLFWVLIVYLVVRLLLK